jgi:lysophospholipase L1-like esterase
MATAVAGPGPAALRRHSDRRARVSAGVVVVWAAFAAGADAQSRVPAPKELRIVALGDSTTARARDWAPSIREVYADCLPGALASHGIQARVLNAGIGDTTTRDAVVRLNDDVLLHRPDIVVVQFGINDSWIDADKDRIEPRLSRGEFRDNLRTIVHRVAGASARPVLMTPNPMRWLDPYYIEVFTQHTGLLDTKDPRGIDRLPGEYAQDLREVAASEHVPLVDIYAAFEAYCNSAGHSITDLLLAGDGIHPSQAGQRMVCRLLAATLVAMLSPESASGIAPPDRNFRGGE